MASKKILVDLDLSQNQLNNAVLQVLASSPSSPVTGQMYFNSGAAAPRYWNGSAWVWEATDTALLNGQGPSYYLSRANHTGTQIASTISDFDTQVRTSRLDQMAAPTASVGLNSQKITGLADGSADTDAATVGQMNDAVQAAASGLDVKDAVVVATTANITLSGTQTIDGVSVVANDRVLVKNQSTASANGIYIVKAGAWTRAPDADAGTLTSGALVLSVGGTTNAATQWFLSTSDPITVGTTAQTWTQFGAGATYSAGNGLTLTGSTFAAEAGDGITVDGSGINVDSTVARVYAADVGDGSSTTITVTHNLGTQDVIVSLRLKASPYTQALCEVKAATINTVTLGFNTAPTSAEYRCTVMGAA